MNWRATGLAVLATVCSVGCVSVQATPSAYGPLAVPFLDISADGRYLAFLNQVGDLKVLDLESRSSVFSPANRKVKGFLSGGGYEFVEVVGAGGEVIWDCEDSRLCRTDLASGATESFLEHSSSADNVLVGASSRDGQRFVFGTRKGRVFTYSRTGTVRELKPADIWTPVPWPMYTIEADGQLKTFMTASALITAAALSETAQTTEFFPEAGYMRVHDYGDVYFTDALHRGINVWRWGESKPSRIDDGFSDKVRADFSPDGGLLVVNQEGGPPYNVYEVPGFERVGELGLIDRSHCNGVRFLDPQGRYLGVTSSYGKELSVTDLVRPSEGKPEVYDLRLRNRPAGGRRMMVTHPEKGWVFIGLAKGGVDWYRFLPEPTPALEHIATLK